MNSNRRIVFFIEWDTDIFMEFIKGVTLSPSLRGNIVVHIFYRHDILAKLLPKYKPWLFKHPASTEHIDSAWKLLEAYVTRFKFEADYSLMADVKRPRTVESLYTSRAGSSKSSATNSRLPSARLCSYYVISRSTESCKRLADAMYKKRQVHLECVDFQPTTTLLDFVQFKCPHCRIVFAGKRELKSHDTAAHGFLCPNVQCRYHRKENSFREEKDLQHHIKNQLRCAFCPPKVFCSPEMLEIHKRNSHKKCACPCGRYYGERLSYLDHFFAVYPSPATLSSPMAAKCKKLPKLETESK